MKQAKRCLALMLALTMLLMSSLTAVAANKGWHQVNEKDWVYLDENGDPVTDDWRQWIDGEWYYLGSDGFMVMDELIDWNSNRYYVGPNGRMAHDELVTYEKDGQTYYFTGDGSMASNKWIQFEEGYRYFNADGHMLKDAWHQEEDRRYYLGSDGIMFANKLTKPDANGDIFYLGEDGVMVTRSWIYLNNEVYYYFGKDGRAARNGWKEIGEGRYHFEDSGIMSAEAWVSDDGGMRYVDKMGEIVKDTVISKDSQLVYVNKEGYLEETFAGTVVKDGITYTFEDGKADISATEIATPSDAGKVEDMLGTLDQLNKSGADTLLRAEVADALSAGAREQKSQLNEELICELEEVLAAAYGISDSVVSGLVEASPANADSDTYMQVSATGLILASGYKYGDNIADYKLLVEQATPGTAERVTVDVKLMINNEEEELKAPVRLELTPPAVFADAYDTARYTYRVVHTHNGTDRTVSGKWNTDDDGKLQTVTFVADAFSEFALIASPKSSGTTPVYSNGGGYSRTVSAATGKWVRAADGVRWWYQYANGTYPAGGWAQLDWNGVKSWYYFDAEGYMVTGWVIDGDYRYYLHPESDGTQGYMYTGWHLIDGKYYYFRPESGGPQGSLFLNGTTPDGYVVDANGVRIQ